MPRPESCNYFDQLQRNLDTKNYHPTIMVVIARITVAVAATIINAAVTVLQYTLRLSFVVLLIFVLYNINTAIAWSAIARKLHSSLWPSLLRSDSVSSKSAGTRIFLILGLASLGNLLVAIASVVTPLGLGDTTITSTKYKPVDAVYVPDTSPMGSATSPRDQFTFGRICDFGELPCPGNGDNMTTHIPSSIMDIFSSTPYGPFSMQYRRYYQGSAGFSFNYTMTLSDLTVSESFILREDLFAIEGLIVDLSRSPGVGFLNHTLPSLQHGGVWSTDVLWLEPISSCVNKNITIDWMLARNNDGILSPYNLTDRGGLFNLTSQYPTINLTGQNVDLYEHAYGAASIDNHITMTSFNVTRNESYYGRVFPINSTFPLYDHATSTDRIVLSNFQFSTSEPTSPQNFCEQQYGINAESPPNISTINIQCGILLGPPQRTDGGDPRVLGDNVTMSRNIYACASGTRARMQTVHFSFNGTKDLGGIHINRQNATAPTLWAFEKTSLNPFQIDLYWGRVADSYESHPSLSTIRSEVLYLPAGESATPDTTPSSINTRVWSSAVYNDFPPTDYSGSNNFALFTKWRSLISADPINGPAHILNLIWTDIIANNLVGTHTTPTLLAAENVPSASYRLIYGIPAGLLLVTWFPLFLAAIFILVTGSVKPSYIKSLLNNTSVGRVVTSTTALRVVSGTPSSDVPMEGDDNSTSMPSDMDNVDDKDIPGTREWCKTTAQMPVAFGSQTVRLRNERGDGAEVHEPLPSSSLTTKMGAKPEELSSSDATKQSLRYALIDFAKVE